MAGGIALQEQATQAYHSAAPAIHRLFAYYSPMGGERASTTRRRLAGEACCVCKVSLTPEPNQKAGERYCARCEPRRRVYMSFERLDGWHCHFLEEDLKTRLPRTLRFAKADKIVQLAERTGALRDLACRQAIEHGVSVGKGGVWLMLTPEQYARLS
jgi:hypothetical protein